MKKLTKTIIIVLVSSFLLSNMQIGIFIKAMMPDVIVENKENDDVDLSLIPNIEEIEEKRTENSKTYKKENGMYETKYYKEQIHFKNEEGYQEIDNTLNLKEDKYINKDNAYHISLPKTLNKNESINITYNNEQINIYYDINNNISSNLSNKVNRNNKNLKDEISYQLNNLEIVEYIIKQNSVKENIILNEYIKDYNYSYFIETTLNLEKIDGKLLFKNKNNETIFVMNEYYMYDSNNNESTNITYDIHEVKKDLYKIIVTPSDEFLKEAVFPVTIDPEITFMNGGFTSGISDVYSVDLETDTTTYLNDGVFTINNRDKDNSNDDLIAYLEFNLISDYTVDVSSILNNNQFMYAYLTLPTYNTNVTNNTNVNLNLVDNLTDTSKILVDSESIVNNNNFNHKFNIYDTFVNKMDDLKNGSTNLLFELSLEGNSNSSITYSLYGNITGTPVVSIGYLDEAGLNDYYTYESLPMNNESSFYIAHNSGNLTYIYNTYNDKNLINLSHIYNVNRRNENSPYGKGFNINYNEKITESTMNRMILTKGDYSTIIYNETTENNYLSTDGSNSSLTKVYDENNNLIEYVIKELNGELKKYDSNGKLTKIYPNYLDENVYVTLIYDSMDRISSIKDSYNNELILTYCAFDTSDEYLFAVEVKKYDPTIEADFKYAFPTVMVFNYNNGKLTDITEDYQLYSTDDTITYIEYDTNTRINKVHKNNIGYTFLYDDFNRIEKASVYSNMYNNGNYLNFAYSKNGKKTIISNGLNDITSYTFDKYYHTISIETSDGYTTFYKYEDIYYDDEGNYILEPNYNLNHKVIVQSNAFKNVYNPVNNHGFEVITSGDIYGWTSNLSNNSTSSINTNEYLYGSKVLEIDNKINSSYVYQEIYVESGKTYIISGYIKNINTSGGAYIDVEAIGANITNVEKDNYIVNEKNL